MDYLTEEKEYQPTRQVIIHFREFLQLLREISGDIRYEELISQLECNQSIEKGGLTMCELLDKYENKGIQKGIWALVETC